MATVIACVSALASELRSALVDPVLILRAPEHDGEIRFSLPVGEIGGVTDGVERGLQANRTSVSQPLPHRGLASL
jgi:hypothetical protein